MDEVLFTIDVTPLGVLAWFLFGFLLVIVAMACNTPRYQWRKDFPDALLIGAVIGVIWPLGVALYLLVWWGGREGIATWIQATKRSFAPQGFTPDWA